MNKFNKKIILFLLPSLIAILLSSYVVFVTQSPIYHASEKPNPTIVADKGDTKPLSVKDKEIKYKKSIKTAEIVAIVIASVFTASCIVLFTVLGIRTSKKNKKFMEEVKRKNLI